MHALCEEPGQAVDPVVIDGPVHGSWIGTAAEFAQLGAEWDSLFQRANPENIFLSFGWMSTWWKHFGKGQLAVIAVRDSDGRLAAVAPFYVARSSEGLGARRLGFLADEHVGSDYLNILADARFGAAAGEEIARVLFAHHRCWDYIELRDTADSPAMAALKTGLRSRGMCVSESSRRTCRYIPLPPTFQKYLAGISTGLRANYRRRWRALQHEHQAECLAVSDAAALERHFPDLIALHRMRFAQRGGESAFLAPGVPEFHAEAMRVLTAQGFVRLFLLQAGGEAVAALYGFSVGRTFQFYQCGMDPGWVRYGLGQVLIGNAIEQTIAAGHATFDFLRGDESYKTGWADHRHENTTLRFFDQRPASIAARWSFRISTAVRGAAQSAKARLLGHSAGARLLAHKAKARLLARWGRAGASGGAARAGPASQATLLLPAFPETLCQNAMHRSLAEYYHWEEVDRGIRIYMHAGMADRLQAEVLGAAGSGRVGGMETGGILLGRAEGDRGRPVIVIDDFVPVPCSHHGGPLYDLSDEDSVKLEAALLRATLAARESPAAPVVVGYYRSHMRDGLWLSPTDLLTIESYFQAPANVFLLVKGVAGTQACTAGFFFWEDGRIQSQFSSLEVALGRTPSSPSLSAALPAEPVLPAGLNGDLNDDLPGDLAELFRKAALPLPSHACAPNAAPPARQPAVMDSLYADPSAGWNEGWNGYEPGKPPVLGAAPAAHPGTTLHALPGLLLRGATILIASAALVISVVTYLGAPRPVGQEAASSTAAASVLGLQADANPPDLLVTWNRNAHEIVAARRGTLTIRHGGIQDTLDLDKTQLARGSRLCGPAINDVQVRLEVYGPDDGSVSQSIRATAGGAR